jgi:hypothetical protein
MSTLTNREKNNAHDNREVVRPKAVHYEFSALTAAVNSWFGLAVVTVDEEVYSPYAGA